MMKDVAINEQDVTEEQGEGNDEEEMESTQTSKPFIIE